MTTARRRALAVRWLGAIALAWAAVGALAAPAAAAGPCTYSVNGQNLDAADTPDRAITVPIGEEVALSAAGPGPLGQVRIEAEFWPLSVGVYEPASTTELAWSGTTRLADQGVTVLGLYHVRVDEDLPQCPPSQGWVRVTGGNPILTLPGAIGLGVAVLGLVFVMLALRSALLGGGGLGLAALGGALAGLGTLVIAQQAGATPVDAGSAALWAGVPGVVAPAVTKVVGRGRLARVGSSVSDHAPTAARAEESLGAGAAEERPGWASAKPPTAEVEPAGAHGAVAEAAAGPAEAGAEPAAAAAGPVEAAAGPVEAGAGPVEATAGPAEAGAEPAAAGGEPPPDLAAEPPPPAEPVAAAVGGPVAAAGPVAADPPRTSYARLDAPEAVVAAAPFDLVVGLAAAPDAEVGAAPIVRPAWSIGPYTLTIQLLAEGFERIDAAADPWRIDLPVTAEVPYPRAALRLRAVAADRPVRARQVRALYSVQGQAMGEASRPIAVVDSAARLAALEPAEPQAPATLSTPRGEDAPDLTIRIEHRDDQAGGAFWWQMLVRDGIDVRPASDPHPVDLGSEAREFLQEIIESVRANEGKASMRPALLGIGHRIAQQVPPAFWEVFAQVAAAVAPAPPSIQILSAEAHIPWELAVLPHDVAPVDPAASRFLGAQADVGRWVIGEPPPRVPPPGRLTVRSIAVISGVFTGPARLEQAEAEADALETEFDADPIQAVDEAVLDCLAHQPPYDVIHFAVHGSYAQAGDPAAPAGAPSHVRPLVQLADGTSLDENTVMGCEPLPGSPLVFLNACQVGNGRQVLGDYAGMSAAFLYAGAAAVVAPLWSIDDTAAREIGLRFYRRIFDGASPAAALRLERASFLTSADTASSTFLAYQYYGHPSLKLERAQP